MFLRLFIIISLDSLICKIHIKIWTVSFFQNLFNQVMIENDWGLFFYKLVKRNQESSRSLAVYGNRYSGVWNQPGCSNFPIWGLCVAQMTVLKSGFLSLVTFVYNFGGERV